MYSEVQTICVTNLTRLGGRIVRVERTLLRVRPLIEGCDQPGLSHSRRSSSEFPNQLLLVTDDQNPVSYGQ